MEKIGQTETIVPSKVSNTRFIARMVDGKPYLICEGEAESDNRVIGYISEVRKSSIEFRSVVSLANLLALKI